MNRPGYAVITGTDGRVYRLGGSLLLDVQKHMQKMTTLGKINYPIEKAVVDLYYSIPASSVAWIDGPSELQEAARKSALAKQKAQNEAKVKALTPAKSKTNTAADSTSTTETDPVGFTTAFFTEKNKADWNLPPHKWSLPLSFADGSYSPVEKDETRRGKIFFYAYGEKQTVMKATPNNRPGGPPILKPVPVNLTSARSYGFQFMWNPESYVVQNALMTTATPSKEDIFVAGQGMFPGASTVSFTIRLDRTNDMAALLRESNFDDSGLYNFYYSGDELPYANMSVQDKANPGVTKIEWLRRYGTRADIEYLYRVCNDINTINRTLSEGFISADVGYIGYQLVGIELGPISYTGYITGININHVTFNEKYIPIRSDVTISANVMAIATGTTLATKVG